MTCFTKYKTLMCILTLFLHLHFDLNPYCHLNPNIMFSKPSNPNSKSSKYLSFSLTGYFQTHPVCLCSQGVGAPFLLTSATMVSEPFGFGGLHPLWFKWLNSTIIKMRGQHSLWKQQFYRALNQLYTCLEFSHPYLAELRLCTFTHFCCNHSWFRLFPATYSLSLSACESYFWSSQCWLMLYVHIHWPGCSRNIWNHE